MTPEKQLAEIGAATPGAVDAGSSSVHERLKWELREAYRALLMADGANWGEFCGCCGVLLSLEANDEECGPAHTATQLAHEWLERNKALATPAQPEAAPTEGLGKEGGIAANRFDCSNCGIGVRVDEDACCASCGRDAIEVADGIPTGPLREAYLRVALQADAHGPSLITRLALAAIESAIDDAEHHNPAGHYEAARAALAGFAPAPTETLPKHTYACNSRWMADADLGVPEVLRVCICVEQKPPTETPAGPREGLLIDTEEIETCFLVAFGDSEGWHPSESAGMFFSYEAAQKYVEVEQAHRLAEGDFEHSEISILRCLQFELRVVNDFTDPEHPTNRKAKP